MRSSLVSFWLALAISLASVSTLFVSWRWWHGSNRAVITAGWLLAVLSLSLWIRVSGAELGTTYASITVAFAAWAWAGALGRGARGRGERRHQPRVPRDAPGWSATGRTFARAFVAVPLAGAASLLASTALVAGLPWSAVNRYVLAIGLAPIVWGVLALWAGMTPRLTRVALLFAGVSVAASAVLFVE